MSKDERLYVRITTKFFREPKITRLTPSAKIALLEMIAHCRELPNDGFLESNYAQRMWGEEILELVRNDDANPSLIAVEGGWQIRDYTEHQQSVAEIEEFRRRQSENGKKGGRPPKAAQNSAKKPSGFNLANPLAKPNETQKKAESESESESYKDLTSINSQSVTPRPVDNSKTDSKNRSSEADAGARTLAQTQGLDLDAIKQLAESECARSLTDPQALRLGVSIVSRSKTRVKAPTRYVSTAFRDWAEIQQLIDSEILI